MRIGAVGFSPYVYRVNSVSASSLSRVSPIGDDLLASKTDFSGLSGVKNDENATINPLKRGETANFADVLAMQMQMGRLHAERIFHSSGSSELSDNAREITESVEKPEYAEEPMAGE